MNLLKFFKGIKNYLDKLLSSYLGFQNASVKILCHLYLDKLWNKQGGHFAEIYAGMIQHVYQVPGEENKQNFLMFGCLKGWQFLEKRCCSRRALFQVASDTNIAV